jgi:hypothetical protein
VETTISPLDVDEQQVEIPDDYNSQVQLFIDTTNKKRKLDAELKDLNATIYALKPAILSYWETLPGKHDEKQLGQMIYRSREMTVRSKDGDTMSLVEKICDLPDSSFLLSTNASRMKSWLKDRMTPEDSRTWEFQADKIPSTLREFIEVDEYFDIRMKKDPSFNG